MQIVQRLWPPSKWITVLFIGSLLFLLYWPCLLVKPAGDDWLLITPVRQMIRTSGIIGAIPQLFTYAIDKFYRPFALVPQLFSQDSFLGLQAVKLIAVIWLFVLTRTVGVKLNLPKGWPTIAAFLTVFHQIFVSVITEVDLWGDLFSALAVVGIILSMVSYAKTDISSLRYQIEVTLWSTLAIFSKESGIICFLIPLLFALFNPLSTSTKCRRIYVISSIFPFMIALIY
ncbi:MAG: hypothetical protein ACOZB3_06715, partial [Calditrichota bacterium]